MTLVMDEEFEARPCPGCRSQSMDPPVVRAGIQAESRSFQALRPYWNGFFKEKAFFSYNRCQGCNLLYCPTFFSASQLGELYRQMPDNTAGVPLSALARTQGGYFRSLRKHSPSGGAYLETGPDIGLFTEFAAKEGNYSTYWLFEPNRVVWDVLRGKIPSKDVNISADMFGFDVVPDRTLSAAVMIHVLDHLLDPRGILDLLRPKLRDDAVVLFVTHDESSFLARIAGARWPAYCLQHPQIYRSSSIERLLGHSGYRVVEIDKSYNHFPVTYLAKHLLWLLGIKAKLPSIEFIQLPLKLGNLITIAKPM